MSESVQEPVFQERSSFLWFKIMKRKKSSRSKKKVKRSGLFSQWFWSGLKVQFSRFMTRGAAFGLLLLLGLLLVEWVTHRARDMDFFRVHTKTVRCLGRPEWLAASNRITTEVVGGIQTNLSRFPSNQIFDETLEKALMNHPDAFSPWIESVQGFERIYPSRYRVRLKLRRPVAVFSESNRSFFIDGSGVVITSVDHLDQGRISSDLPLITGFGTAHPVREGLSTRNRALIEGAAVAREIEIFKEIDKVSDLRISEIDVARFGEGRPDGVTLYTGDNVRIQWGRSAQNIRFQGIDPTPMEKAIKLRTVLEDRPGLKGVQEVKLTFKKVQTTYVPVDSGA